MVLCVRHPNNRNKAAGRASIRLLAWGVVCVLTGAISCRSAETTWQEKLAKELQQIADEADGVVGIAVITDSGDTIAINNEEHYPLMSVFKLHQAIATCHHMQQAAISLDSTVTISRSSLNPSTWSPMLTDYSGDSLTLSYRRLMRYTLEQSDNNASNYLFENIHSVAATDSLIGRIIPRADFRLTYTEADMQMEHSRAYDNYSTPLGAAMLINRLYTDSTLLTRPDSEFICRSLEECATGNDRIPAPLLDKEGITIGHKTGSGYRDNGVLVAHNDVAFIRLPDGRNYTLAVLIKNFRGTDQAASALIARISAATHTTITSEV